MHCDIHNNIVDEDSEEMQGMSWITSKECNTIQRAIKYAITWAHKEWLKMMQLATNTIIATQSYLLLTIKCFKTRVETL